MKFSTIKALIGWAFQLAEAIPVKSAKYGEFTGASFGGLTPDEQKKMAIDILAKVGRLPADEQAVLAAYYTAATKAVNEAADVLPPMPTGLKRELVKGWTVQLDRDQKEMAATYGLSESTMTRRKQQVFRYLDELMGKALDTLEIQLLPYLQHVSHKNFHRVMTECCAAA